MTIIAQVIKVVATQDVKLSLITIVDGKLGLELKHGYEVKKGDILTIILSNFHSYKSYFTEYKDLDNLTNTSNLAIKEKTEVVSNEQNVINMIVNVDKNGNVTAETKDKPSIMNLISNRNGENFTPAKNITFA